MIWMGKASGLAAGVMAIAVAACNGGVDVEGVGSTVTSSSATSTTSSTSSSTGGGMGGSGGAGGGMLPPPSCAPGEGAIVAARFYSSTLIAVDDAGTWTFDALSLPPAQSFVTYVDGYDHLGVLWVDGASTPEQTHFAVTGDGTSFDEHDVHAWPASEVGPLAAVTRDVLFGRDMTGMGIARFNEDDFDWSPYPGGPVPIEEASSAAPLSSGAILAVGRGLQGELCDVANDGAGWGSVHCRDEITVASGGEIPVTRPQAVTLPNGDVVVVYYQAAGSTLAATTLHAGVWSAPEPITSSVIGISFALTATPQGDVIAVLPSELSEVNALRYRPGTGWGKPILVAPGGYVVGVAPGICGDDALVALGSESSEGSVGVARLRGNAVEVTYVGAIPDDRVYQISIATRP